MARVRNIVYFKSILWSAFSYYNIFVKVMISMETGDTANGVKGTRPQQMGSSLNDNTLPAQWSLIRILTFLK